MEPIEQVAGGRIVVLNGFPGSGKFTILNQVKELLPAKTTCLLDNHLLIDPVAAVIPERSDEHHDLRRIIRAPIFKKLGELAEQGHTVLMTACLGDNNEKDLAFLQEHLDMVRGTIVPMYWINVHCNQTALEKRLVMPERHQGSKSKLTDGDLNVHEAALIYRPVTKLEITIPSGLAPSSIHGLLQEFPDLISNKGSYSD
ncbi:hypothetical protein FDECE_9289 [Fusarium decemcellulare]|nr:hypothetical protein FDECE_9289 [Fusarium decemcellulare]